MPIGIVPVFIMEIAVFIAVFKQLALKSRLFKHRPQSLIIIDDPMRIGRMVRVSVSAGLYHILIPLAAEIGIRHGHADVSARFKDSGNPDLGDYSAYAHDFFWNNAFRQGYDNVTSDKDFKELGRYFADVNTAYFAGHVPRELADEDKLARWENQGGFTGRYLRTILAEAGVDHTRLTFDYR